MGCNQSIFNFLERNEIFNFRERKNAIVIGEQQMSDISGVSHNSLFKSWLIGKGWNAESIDMGDHPLYSSSLKHDLALPLPIDLHRKWDILFDFGTGEHIRDQAQYWKNCHDLVKAGGVRVHILPPIGTWPLHCKFRYDEVFFDKICENYKYQKIHDQMINESNQQYTLHACIFLNSALDFDKEVFQSRILSFIDEEIIFFDKDLYNPM